MYCGVEVEELQRETLCPLESTWLPSGQLEQPQFSWYLVTFSPLGSALARNSSQHLCAWLRGEACSELGHCHQRKGHQGGATSTMAHLGRCQLPCKKLLALPSTRQVHLVHSTY